MFWDRVAGVYDLFANYYNAVMHRALCQEVASLVSLAVWAKIEPLIEGLPLVAHNSSFDEGCLRSVFNDEIINEYKDVLSREKFHLNQSDITLAMKVITDYGVNLGRTKVNDEAFLDPRDIVFYEVKMSKEDAYLVTGNIKHFPQKTFCGHTEGND